jgi:SAM-dependent methyltransferase
MTQHLEPAVYRSRAIRSAGIAIEDDPEPMVQQQLARLKFIDEKVGVRGCRVLDWGCGSGFNCTWLKGTGQVREAMGVDLSADAIHLARQAYPDVEFAVGNACDPALAIRPKHWDRIISCEVLEHVPDMTGFLANLRRHLSDDGVAVVSTPNRLVFSLGHEPSPVNREHIKELTLGEFSRLLTPHFSGVEIYGQNFKTQTLLEAWKDDVRRKIHQLERGTRWATAPTFTQRWRRNGLIDRLYQIAPLRAAWRFARWKIVGGIRTRVEMARNTYDYRDFEFVTGDLSDSVWFCGILRP